MERERWAARQSGWAEEKAAHCCPGMSFCGNCSFCCIRAVAVQSLQEADFPIWMLQTVSAKAVARHRAGVLSGTNAQLCQLP